MGDLLGKRGVLMRPDGITPTLADLPAIEAGTFDFAGWQHMSLAGKKAAGAELDGKLHPEFPIRSPP